MLKSSLSLKNLILNLKGQTTKREMSQFCMIYTTTDKQEVAEKIATDLVSQDLAACVQIGEVKSFYKWKGQVENANEFRLVIKAMSANYDSIEKRISHLHNYELPQVIKVDISGGSEAYLKWLSNEKI